MDCEHVSIYFQDTGHGNDRRRKAQMGVLIWFNQNHRITFQLIDDVFFDLHVILSWKLDACHVFSVSFF